jgi:hypothetical protein
MHKNRSEGVAEKEGAESAKLRRLTGRSRRGRTTTTSLRERRSGRTCNPIRRSCVVVPSVRRNKLLREETAHSRTAKVRKRSEKARRKNNENVLNAASTNPQAPLPLSTGANSTPSPSSPFRLSPLILTDDGDSVLTLPRSTDEAREVKVVEAVRGVGENESSSRAV